ncbi:kinase-like domain-containing protein [Jimgerdemannia flammicorona]|uniref:Kinase-like domain-containing protein n=1 Tax=Jimgerdemannia flammicorona TaxID=994334 RepID=A0A433QJJ5_9FUNG|nr:kinase-like domain-containing protein [Jimgerdemannia flammicorona]
MYPQILGAVQVLHFQNLQHNDLKCGNLLVLWTSGRPVVKLADLGFTRSPEEQRRKFARLGTRPYMSPEVFSGDKAKWRPYAADVWALGIILLEFVAGSRPWEEADDTDPSYSEFLQDRRIFLNHISSLTVAATDLLLLILEPDPSIRPSIGVLVEHFESLGAVFQSVQDKVAKENSVLRAFDDDGNLALDALLAKGVSKSSLCLSFLQENPDADVAPDPIPQSQQKTECTNPLLPEQTVIKTGKGWKVVRKRARDDQDTKIDEPAKDQDAKVEEEREKDQDATVEEARAKDQDAKVEEERPSKKRAISVGENDEDQIGADMVVGESGVHAKAGDNQTSNPATREARQKYLKDMMNLACTHAKTKMRDWGSIGGQQSFKLWFNTVIWPSVLPTLDQIVSLYENHLGETIVTGL